MKGLVLVLVDSEAQEETRVLYDAKVAPSVVIYGQRLRTTRVLVSIGQRQGHARVRTLSGSLGSRGPSRANAVKRPKPISVRDITGCRCRVHRRRYLGVGDGPRGWRIRWRGQPVITRPQWFPDVADAMTHAGKVIPESDSCTEDSQVPLFGNVTLPR